MTHSDSPHSLRARLFAALSAEALTHDPERSILLGMQALNTTLAHGEPAEFAADEALRRALWRSRLYRRLGDDDPTTPHPTCAAWSNDGMRIATSGSNCPIVLWDVASGKRLWSSGNSSQIYCIAFSRDGTRIAAGGLQSNAVVLNAANGTLLKTIAAGYASGLAFSPDGRRLAIQTTDASGVWDIETGTRVIALGGGSTANIAWSSDGARIATCTHGIQLWNAESGAALRTLGPEREVRSVDWSPDGTRLAAGLDALCEVWDATTGTQRMIASEFALSGGLVAWSPDGARLAKRGHGDTATVYDADEGRLLLTLNGQFEGDFRTPYGGVFLAWHPNGARLAVGPGLNGPPFGAAAKTSRARPTLASTKIWDIRSDDVFDGDVCLALHPPQTILDAAWSRDGEHIAISTADAVVVFDADKGLPWRQLPLHAQDAAKKLHWSPDGVWLTTSGHGFGGGATRLWRVADGVELTTLPAATPIAVDALRLLSWSASGHRLAARIDDTQVDVWDMRTQQSVSSLNEASGVTRLALSPDGTRLATASDRTAAIRIWDVESGRLLVVLGSSAPFTGADDEYHLAIDGLAWSPDNRRIVSITSDAVTTWDTATGEALSSFANPKGYSGPMQTDQDPLDLRNFDFSSDRRHLALLAILSEQRSNGCVGIRCSDTGRDGPQSTFWDVECSLPLPEPAFLRFENFAPPYPTVPPLVRWRPDGQQSATAMRMSQRLYGGPHSSAWGDIDRPVRVVDAATGRATMGLGRVEIAGMAWRPDGKRLACWYGGRLDIHPIDPHELMALARTRVTRNFTFDECVRYFDGDDPPPIP